MVAHLYPFLSFARQYSGNDQLYPKNERNRANILLLSHTSGLDHGSPGGCDEMDEHVSWRLDNLPLAKRFDFNSWQTFDQALSL